MDRLAMLIATAPIWKPIAKNLWVGLIGAATAYAIDRGFFDAHLADTIANDLIQLGNHLFQ